jgi:D-tyrosyl-tRNA(Tyr) deacylase|tara:strand:+ start:1295 stop:1762 length:468 start_codon:yes stop_codon:yes gene_type:complete
MVYKYKVMIALIQRVSEASVSVKGKTVVSIGKGLLVLLGMEKNDSTQEADRIAEKLLRCRVFEDDNGRLNLDVSAINGEVLVVPNFTLAADTKKGNRPGFSTALEANKAEPLFDYLIQQLERSHPLIKQGIFGANMQVKLVNDGPVTISLKAHNP